MIFVKVTSPAGRAIYVDDDYSAPEGLAPTTLTLDAGTHTLTTQTMAGVVDYSGTVSDVPDGQTVSIALQPVSAS